MKNSYKSQRAFFHCNSFEKFSLFDIINSFVYGVNGDKNHWKKIKGKVYWTLNFYGIYKSLKNFYLANSI